MNNQDLLEIKKKYQDLVRLYSNCKSCVDCDFCDKAEILADELLTSLEELDVSLLDGKQKDDLKRMLFFVSSIFDELKKI